MFLGMFRYICERYILQHVLNKSRGRIFGISVLIYLCKYETKEYQDHETLIDDIVICVFVMYNNIDS